MTDEVIVTVEREVVHGDGALRDRTRQEQNSSEPRTYSDRATPEELAIMKEFDQAVPNIQDRALEATVESAQSTPTENTQTNNPVFDTERYPYHQLVKIATFFTGEHGEIHGSITKSPERFDVRDVVKERGGYTLKVFDRIGDETTEVFLPQGALKRCGDAGLAIKLVEEEKEKRSLLELVNDHLMSGRYKKLEGLVFMGVQPDNELVQRRYQEIFTANIGDKPFPTVVREKDRVYLSGMEKIRKSTGIGPELSDSQKAQVQERYISILSEEENMNKLDSWYDATCLKAEDSPELQDAFVKTMVEIGISSSGRHENIYRKERGSEEIETLKRVSESGITPESRERAFSKVAQADASIYWTSKYVKGLQETVGGAVPESVLDGLVRKGFTKDWRGGNFEDVKEAKKQFPSLEYKPEIVGETCHYWIDRGRPENAQKIVDFTGCEFDIPREEVLEKCREYIEKGKFRAVKYLCNLAGVEDERGELREALLDYVDNQKTEGSRE